MPYGCAGSRNLSQASRIGFEKAIKHKTYFIVAGYTDDGGEELSVRREIINKAAIDPELLTNLIAISARNEEALALKISRVRQLMPIETMTVFVETRNAVSVKAIFKRKFGKTLQIRKFKARFEFNHQWITTSTSFAWFSRNWLLRVWFAMKKRMGRRLRKKIRFLFRSY
jgi:hypothetical protein